MYSKYDNKNIEISIILLTLNEVKNIEVLIDTIVFLMRNENKKFEIIVSDGNSSDGTLDLLKKIAIKYKEVKIIISSKKGYGIQLMNGFSSVVGEIVIYMDGDGQYIADDILRFIDTPSYAIVSATKKINKTSILRKIISKFFSYLINLITGIKIPDFTSGFKKIPGKLAKKIKLNWGLYFLASTELIIDGKKMGYEIITIPVKCKKREYGKSKLISFLGVKSLLADLFSFIKYKLYK